MPKKKFTIGRDAGNGQFIPVEEAKERKNNAIVEHIERKKHK